MRRTTRGQENADSTLRANRRLPAPEQGWYLSEVDSLGRADVSAVELKPRILVVDDDEDVRQLTHTILAGVGYRVSCASSGLEALEQLAEKAFDLVLLDINMPEMDGWETLRLIRADEDHAAVPVAMFSVKNEVRDRIHSMQDGATDYITKPFGMETLLERVGHVLAARSR